MNVVMMRIRWTSLLLGLMVLSVGFSGAALSQVTIERSRDIEVDTGTSLPESSGGSVSTEESVEGEGAAPVFETDTPSETASESEASGNTIEFVPTPAANSDPDSSAESAAVVRYNIRKNVCTGNWSMSELNALFPGVDAELVRDVCG